MTTPPPTDEINQDISLIVSGNFTPDSVGPDTYNAVVERARENVGAYLAVFESQFLGEYYDPLTQSELYPTALLEVVSPADPDAVQAMAGRLMRQYDTTLVLFDRAPDADVLAEVFDEDTVHMAVRLDDRRRQLRSLTDRSTDDA